MSTARTLQILKEQKEAMQKKMQPVPRLPISGIPEDAVSKHIRTHFDNASIQYPDWPSSGVFINTNESGTDETAERLKEFPRIQHACHIGFSGWHNFDIMALRQSDRGIICDINPENALFLYFALSNLRFCADRKKFVEAMIETVTEVTYYDPQRKNAWGVFFAFNVSTMPLYLESEHSDAENEIRLELKRQTSWLYTDERYAHMRRLALQDKIALITENICAHEKFAELLTFLQTNGINIDTVYVSNILVMLANEDKLAAFKTMMKFLSSSKTLAIDARIPPGQLPDPKMGYTYTLFQRCSMLDEIYENGASVMDWFFPGFRPILRSTQQAAALQAQAKQIEPSHSPASGLKF